MEDIDRHKLIKCIAEFCPYRDTCYRHRINRKGSDPCFDCSDTCNKDTGFDSYIPMMRN